MARKKDKASRKNRGDADGCTMLTPPGSATKNKQQGALVEGQAPGMQEELKVYLPGMELAEGEELEADPSAYVMLHKMNTEWPCLSFDIIKDGGPEERSSFPMSGMLVTGTQASERAQNQLLLMRCTNMKKTFERDENDENNEEGNDEDSDSEESDEEEGGADGHRKHDPCHYVVSIPHDGGVNRVRSSSVAVDGCLEHLLTATWADTGIVNIWDLKSPFADLCAVPPGSPSSQTRLGMMPACSVKKHKEEGFALAWSPLTLGRLLSGDCGGIAHLTELRSDGKFETGGEAFRGHGGSVEDLQWSPTESTVFASCSTDKTVRIWDTRLPRHQAALAGIVHDCDVNVISWNRHVTHLLASGADSGKFSTWDLRRWSPSSISAVMESVSTFDWHRGAVTSIEWSPHDPSVLAVSGADDQLTIWDMSVEGEDGSSGGEDFAGRRVPSQLLFIHQGQTEIKELHWHSQLSGVLVSTALQGFNIFKTISV